MTEPLRNIPNSFDKQVVAEIDARLAAAQADERATIAWVIESGSRAWGFLSPDSDYDCRFLFVREEAAYLSPWLQRDVIETPLDKIFDVNGWELGKAIKLLLKGNAVVIEWLTSPIIYRGDPWLRDGLLELARNFTDRDAIARHYIHLGEGQRRTCFADERDVALKKLFYAMRPAAALRWMRCHPDSRIAPMHFPTLMAQCAPPQEVADIAADLIAQKATTREMGSAALPTAIRDFVDSEFAAAREAFGQKGRLPSAEAKAVAADFFRAAIRRYDGQSWPQ